MYKIREVDALENDIADTLQELNTAMDCFPTLTHWEIENGHWWLAELEGDAVAFAGMVSSRQYNNVGYLNRAGVLPDHRGNKLQQRLMRVRLAKAKRLGWSHITSECTGTVYSANNFIRCGFKMYEPRKPWAFATTNYWIKKL
jgi:GNAT superfamily N-acetyltransferase